MQANLLRVIKAYAEKLKTQTETPVIIAPSEVNSERFHVELSLLPHPVAVGNGRVQFRMRATVKAEIPSSDTAINDCLNRSLTLAAFFDTAQGFDIDADNELYGIAHHSSLRDDDDLFSDLMSEQRSYSYNESWLVELEFNLDTIKGA